MTEPKFQNEVHLENHIGDPAQTLNRALTNKFYNRMSRERETTTNSTFVPNPDYGHETAMDALQDYTSIANQILQGPINEWLDASKDYDTRAFSCTIDNDFVGYGFKFEKDEIKAYGTNVITMVLQQIPYEEPYYQIITAFPDISRHQAVSDPKSKPTVIHLPEFDIPDLIQQTKVYKEKLRPPQQQQARSYGSNKFKPRELGDATLKKDLHEQYVAITEDLTQIELRKTEPPKETESRTVTGTYNEMRVPTFGSQSTHDVSPEFH